MLLNKFIPSLSVLVPGLMIWACSGIDTAGTSEESEGIVALAGKRVSGAAQKGPLVKGSGVILRETSAEGNLEPTGREFNATITGDRGEFTVDSINLECQYVLLSAEGFYTHEKDGTLSKCSMRLDAVTNLEKRNTSNINLLTHFEYKRVLNLVKSGKTFAEAKKQAATEVLGAFGVKLEISNAEDLNIYNTTEGDRTLYNISVFIDQRELWDPWKGEGDSYDEWEHWTLPERINCSNLQKFMDGFADDFADDGELGDSIMMNIASYAYSTARAYSHMEGVSEAGMRAKEDADPGSYDILTIMKKQYDFSKLFLLNYWNVELCTEDLWGEYRTFNRPIRYYDLDAGEYKVSDSGYVLCNGYSWKMETKGYLDSLKMKIEHGSGTMTDPRDGKKYKTVSFEFGGKSYEWMAEDLEYSVSTYSPGSIMTGNYVENGLYSWTTAMQIDQKYMKEPVDDGVIKTVHQGVCPAGWHISSSKDWEALIAYVGGINNLLDETWRTDRYAAFGKDLMGVFYNKFDFNLEPMDKRYLELYYHTYSNKSFGENVEAELDSLWNYYGEDSLGEENWVRSYLDNYRNYRLPDLSTFEISIGYARTISEPRKIARVRCVKN